MPDRVIADHKGGNQLLFRIKAVMRILRDFEVCGFESLYVRCHALAQVVQGNEDSPLIARAPLPSRAIPSTTDHRLFIWSSSTSYLTPMRRFGRKRTNAGM